VTDADVVAAVRAHDPAATSEIGDELGVSRQSADRRLRRLCDDERISSKKVGPSLVWFMPRETSAQPANATETPNVDDGLPSDATAETRRTDDENDTDTDDDINPAPCGSF
jgi:predicted ArsR family transcriptional regulator